MNTITVSTRGRIVIPLQLRKRLKMKKGTRIHIAEKEDSIVLTPWTREYFEHMVGGFKDERETFQILACRTAERKIILTSYSICIILYT